MAAHLSQDEVLDFLQSRGGSVKNSELLLHFRSFLREHYDQQRNRALFKKFVNTVATVRQEEGVSHVVLRRRFRVASSSPAGRETPPAPAAHPVSKTVLPVAGILVNNNDVQTNLNFEPCGPRAPATQTADRKTVGFGADDVTVRADPGHVHARRARHRQSYKSAVSQDEDDDDDEDEDEEEKPRPPEEPRPPETAPPQIVIQEDPLEASPGQRSESSYSSVFSASSPPLTSDPRGLNHSYDDLQVLTGGHARVQDLLQRSHRGHLSSERLHGDQPWSAGRDWHQSTGDLCDESSEGSAPSPPLRQHAGLSRRLTSRLRNRMCRSLGADLDLLPEEVAGRPGGSEARLNRLHMISSSLSLRYDLSSSSLSSCSTPPRSRSAADLAELTGAKVATSAPREGGAKQSLVPLERHEHVWLVKAASGSWPDIYSLFREDSSLLNRRDFISGFTVLHWIAKHGDHRVLNTLWYGVEKAGLTLDVNSRSTCGHTPLHIAAIHNHKNMLRLLVKKFDVDVRLRDTSGKRAWQYLSRDAPPDVLQMLGAPAQAGNQEDGASASLPVIQPRRRRRRHYMSSASGERPLTVSGTKVKRSSSIAAFLKHRSLGLRLDPKSDSSF